MAKKATQRKASSRKVGRNRNKCQAYKERLIRVRNKKAKIARHIATHPNDKDAVVSV